MNITKAAAIAKTDILMVALLLSTFQILMFKLRLFIINVADCICWSATAKNNRRKLYQLKQYSNCTAHCKTTDFEQAIRLYHRLNQ